MNRSSPVFLETQRLILTLPSLADLNGIVALRTNPSVMQYMGDGNIQEEAFIKEKLIGMIAYQKKHGIGFCSVFEKKSKEFIGQAGLFHLGFDERQEETEIAYRLLPDYWNKGYATELTKALVDYGFTHLANTKFVAATHVKNSASKNVLEKSGFISIGEIDWYNMEGVLGFEVYKNDAIELVPYDSSWPEKAREEMLKLQELLPSDYVDEIQHVGSTAIPGISAKPLIDIQIVSSFLQELKPIAVLQLKKLNYQFWDENPDPKRLFFVKGMPPYGKKRTHHVRIVDAKLSRWEEKIQFRDYLITHPDVAAEYAELKLKLARQHTYDREKYTEEKGEFVRGVLNKADSQH